MLMTLDSPWDRNSWTTAILKMRLMLWRRLSATSGLDRRACKRSREAMVCRLFLTRWWISRIIADLILSSCSFRTSSVMSWMAISAPAGWAAQAAPPAPAGRLRQRHDPLDPDLVLLLDTLLQADALFHRLEADVLVGVE